MKYEEAPESLSVGDVKYIREDLVKSARPSGNRAVVVVDRGWIYAGDVEVGKEYYGYVLVLSRPILVQGWSEIGFDGMLANPKSPKVRLKPLTGVVEIPVDSVIFKKPVEASWGL